MLAGFNQIYLLSVVFVATIFAALGETFLKMAADGTKGYWDTFCHPVMVYRMVVFVLENLLLAYAYKNGLSFISVGVFQAVCYAVTVSFISWKVFHEQFDLQQVLGVTFCLVGVFLLLSSKKGALSLDTLAGSLFRQ